MPIERTANYERWRIRNPLEFIPGSFRTQDIGRINLSKRIAGKLRRTGKWATQGILVSIQEPPIMKAKLRQIARSLIKRR